MRTESSNTSRKARGFTLIELLIVVAIIAILAAIAVPNFLEAQVRAKVSRVKTDVRTLTTAIVAYSVDENRYPLGFVEGGTSVLGAWTLLEKPIPLRKLAATLRDCLDADLSG